MKYVDDVIIGSPYIVTLDLIKSLGIHEVVHIESREDQVKTEFRDLDPFAVPKALGIYVELPPVENDLTEEDIAQRIQNNNKAQFEAKFANRKAKHDNYNLEEKTVTYESPEAPREDATSLNVDQ